MDMRVGCVNSRKASMARAWREPNHVGALSHGKEVALVLITMRSHQRIVRGENNLSSVFRRHLWLPTLCTMNFGEYVKGEGWVQQENRGVACCSHVNGEKKQSVQSIFGDRARKTF